MPEGNVRKQLFDKILDLNQQFGGPIFEPHVTLVSSFIGNQNELVKKTLTISKRISPFEIEFHKIGFCNEFFFSVFLEVKNTAAFKNAKKIARSGLKINIRSVQPHLSLAYGDYDPLLKKEMIMQVGNFPSGFNVTSIYLAHNNEYELKWKIIEEFKIKGN